MRSAELALSSVELWLISAKVEVDLAKKGMWKRFGPGFLVTAAFIGPGTVTVASKAGAEFGHTLLFAVAFSVFAALMFQEMAAQIANGLILPLVTLFLLIVVNRPSVLGEFANRWFTNLLGCTTLLIVTGLGIYNIVRVFIK